MYGSMAHSIRTLNIYTPLMAALLRHLRFLLRENTQVKRTQAHLLQNESLFKIKQDNTHK